MIFVNNKEVLISKSYHYNLEQMYIIYSNIYIVKNIY